ncbi:MAG: peptidylprolyl isomerase [Bdellovibrionota bacterium]
MFRMKNTTVKEGEVKKVFTHWKVYVVLAAALGSMTFFGVCDPAGPKVGLSGSAAIVGDEKISIAEFRRAYQRYTERLKSQYSDAYDPVKLRPAHATMDSLVRERILYLAATEHGLATSEDEVVQYLVDAGAFADEKTGEFSQSGFENYLRSSGYSEEAFLQEMQRSMTASKFRNLVTSAIFLSKNAAEFEYKISETKLELEYLKLSPANVSVSVDDKEINEFAAKDENKKKIEDWYNSHKSDYLQPEKVHARHILVSYNTARNASSLRVTRDKNAAKERAEKILSMVKQKGANFIEIAKKETDEPTGKGSGGDLGLITRESMAKEFSDVAFAINVGAVSNVVESPFGFHVIKVEAKQAKKDQKLEEVTSEIAGKLIKKEKLPKIVSDKANELLALVKEGASGEAKLKAMIKQYGLEWKKTGKFAANTANIPGLGNQKIMLQKILQLTEKQRLLDEAIESAGNMYIVRLVEKVEPDMKNFDDKRLQQIRNSKLYSSGYYFLNRVEEEEEKKYADRNEVFKNPEFLALDAPNQDVRQQ